MNFIGFFLLILLLLPTSIFSDCTCEQSTNEDDNNNNKTKALKLKLTAIASILAAGAVGVCLPFLGQIFESFSPESNFFLALKFFAAGVILATGFVHVFADANESLENPCLKHKAWGDFPLANFVAMVAAVVVMMVETAITSLFNRSCRNKNGGDEEKHDHQGHLQVHSHASSGHGHGLNDVSGSPEGLLRHRIISQVLEVGILIHSVIIGISLGVSVSPTTIKPLIFALSFHQMFEGMGLGSCITQAKFKIGTIATMSIFFSLTTPIGIAIGFGVSNAYDENSQTALIVEGVLNAASAGILIYMALVDLLAVDCMKPKVQTSSKFQCLAFSSLVLGIGSMSLLARWA